MEVDRKAVVMMECAGLSIEPCDDSQSTREGDSVQAFPVEVVDEGHSIAR
jgi:hypothetical protein